MNIAICEDNCPELEYKHEYHVPHPAEWYWYCKALERRLSKRLCILGGVYRNSRCPKLLATTKYSALMSTPNKEKE